MSGHDAGVRKPIVLYGAGSLALVLNDFLDTNGYRLTAIFSDFRPDRVTAVPAPVIIGAEAIDRWLADEGTSGLAYAVSIGNHHRARLERFKLLLGRGLKPVTLVHPTAFISPRATVGSACQVLAFAFVGAGARIGNAAILNSRASIDHECELGDAVYVGPGAVLAGQVRVGDCSFIGAGAVVLPGVAIAADVVVGAGAVVTKDLKETGTYLGSPARRQKK